MKSPHETLDASATLASVETGREGNASSDHLAPPLAKGARMGRYVVLRLVGVGAMGAVYLAYDPELDRRVALKLIRGGTTAHKRRALLREAQAMAKLAHPNVVNVFDAGEHKGTVYVAMEFVDGGTLKKWLREQPRSWRDVLDKFLPAGRGLVAAHMQELVHRDFKPDNVMVSVEGQVRVMDFGLAQPRSSASGESHEREFQSYSLLTEASVSKVAGTPAYMAPEQAKPQRLSPAADQFAFCVSMWEGICGERPFAGDTYAELYTTATEGRFRPPPPGTRMPRWLRRTLKRGLHRDATRRWPTMKQLLEVLERGRGRWRWQVAVAGLAVLAIPIGLTAAQRQQAVRDRQAAIESCEAEGAAIGEIWNDETRGRLRSGLLSTGVAFADRSAETIVPWLDDYRDDWRSGRTAACRHGTVERDWDAETLDRSTWCFEDRRLQLEATVDQIASLDAAAARRAVRLASYLDPADACLDPKLLHRLPAPPPKIRDRIRVIRKKLADSDRLRHGGHAAQALDVATEARREAATLSWPPLLALARFLEGRCTLETGHLDDAARVLTDAYFDAQKAGSDDVEFRAARSLAGTHSSRGDYQQARVWMRHSERVAEGFVDPGQLDEAEGHYLTMAIQRGLGDYAGAVKEGEMALQQRARVLGSAHPITAAVRRSLGLVHLESGKPKRALGEFEIAYRAWLEAVGPSHPAVGELASMRGRALLLLGQPSEALPLLQEGIGIQQRTLPADHPALAVSLDALGTALEALKLDERALQARERAAKVRALGKAASP